MRCSLADKPKLPDAATSKYKDYDLRHACNQGTFGALISQIF